MKRVVAGREISLAATGVRTAGLPELRTSGIRVASSAARPAPTDEHGSERAPSLSLARLVGRSVGRGSASAVAAGEEMRRRRLVADASLTQRPDKANHCRSIDGRLLSKET
jgi:hypothetical protein